MPTKVQSLQGNEKRKVIHAVLRYTILTSMTAASALCALPAHAVDLNVTSGTFEVTAPGDVSQDRVVVDNTADEDAALQIDTGVTFSKDILLNNGGTLINEGTISRSGVGVDGVYGNVGLAQVTNRAGGSIEVEDIGLWLKASSSLLNTGDGTSITGRIGAALNGTSTVTNELGATIHGGTGSGLYLSDSTVTNQSGATIFSDGAEAIRMSGSGSVTNTGEDSEISGDTFGITIIGDGDVYNLDGAAISGGAAVRIGGTGTVENAGTITSTNGSSAGVSLSSGGTLDNRTGGSISGYKGVFADDIIEIDNAGSIEGTGTTGIDAVAYDSSLTNHGGGTISGVGKAVNIGGDVTNTGGGSRISSNDLGVRAQGGATLRNEDGAEIEAVNLGVDMYDGGDVYNNGGASILATGNTSSGIDVWIYGSVTNSGEGSNITGGNYAVTFNYFDIDSVFELANRDKATINGGYTGVAFFDTEGTLLNEEGAGITANSYGVKFDNSAGTVTNQTGAKITSLFGSGIQMDSGGEINNKSGGTIIGVVTGLVLLNDVGYTILNTGAGSAITATGSDVVDEADAIYVEGPADITNENGATISGIRFGAWMMKGGSFTNEGEDTLIHGDRTALLAQDETTIENKNGARITGGDNGVIFEDGGSLTNESGATITGNSDNGVISHIGGIVTNRGEGSTISGGIAGVLLQGGTGTVINEDGASISGGYGAVALFEGGSVTNGAGSTLEGDTFGIYAEGGSTTISNAGRIIGDVELSNVHDNDVTLFTGSSIDGNLYIDNRTTSALTFDGAGTQLLSEAVTGTFSFGGVLTKQGTGTWIIDKNLLADETNVTNGSLIVGLGGHGTLISNVNVDLGATLGGSGTIFGNVVVDGSVNPGNSPGVLNIVGDYTQTAGSTFNAEIDTDSGLYDQIVASGSATIDPGAILNVTRVGTAPYVVGTQYVFLNAPVGITGSYVVTGDLVISPFLTLADHYDPGLGYLQVEQTLSPADALMAPTANQTSLMNAIQAAPTSPISTVLNNLPSVAALNALMPQLTGEIYPSLASAILEDSRYIRNAAIDRIEDASCDRNLNGTKDCGAHPLRLWSSAIGAWAHDNSGGDVASMSRTTGGMLFGADATYNDFWRAGLLTGYGITHYEMNDRSSNATSEDIHLGFYAGTRPGPLAIKFGALRTWHHVKAGRSVGVTGFYDHLEANYHTATSQVFGEAGYRIAATDNKVQPFINVTYATTSASDFSESGGTAALNAQGNTNSRMQTTLGVHLNGTLTVGSTKIAAEGTLGWRHASGDTTPVSDFTIGGGNAYRIDGRPAARNALTAKADIEMALSEAAIFGLSADGQFARDGSAVGLTARLAVHF